MAYASRVIMLGFASVAAVTSLPAGAQVYDDSLAAKLVDEVLGGPRWAPVARLDVAGVMLSMTPEQARSALRKSGFAPNAEDPLQDGWSTVVSRRAADRIGGTVGRDKVPMFTRAKGAQGETIEVWYSATKDGARATQIKYLMPTARMEKAAFLRSVVAKYGKPTFAQGSKSMWCSQPEKVCASYANRSLPSLMVEVGHANYEIDIKMGQRYSEELKARMVAEVEAAAPKNAKASF